MRLIKKTLKTGLNVVLPSGIKARCDLCVTQDNKFALTSISLEQYLKAEKVNEFSDDDLLPLKLAECDMLITFLGDEYSYYVVFDEHRGILVVDDVDALIITSGFKKCLQEITGYDLTINFPFVWDGEDYEK